MKISPHHLGCEIRRLPREAASETRRPAAQSWPWPEADMLAVGAGTTKILRRCFRPVPLAPCFFAVVLQLGARSPHCTLQPPGGAVPGGPSPPLAPASSGIGAPTPAQHTHTLASLSQSLSFKPAAARLLHPTCPAPPHHAPPRPAPSAVFRPSRTSGPAPAAPSRPLRTAPHRTAPHRPIRTAPAPRLARPFPPPRLPETESLPNVVSPGPTRVWIHRPRRIGTACAFYNKRNKQISASQPTDNRCNKIQNKNGLCSGAANGRHNSTSGGWRR